MLTRHREKKAEEQYQADLTEWEAERDASASLLELAQRYAGEPSSDLLLKPGEALFARVTGASLVEDRRGAGQWQGHSSGVSIPIGSIGGRSVRYRVGASRGHYVQGAPVATAIDTGTILVTNRRVIFQGTRQTRECLFDKMVGFRHDDDGSTTFSVSNRQKPTTVHYGTQIAGWFDFRLDLALAHYRGSVPALTAQLQEQLATLDAAKPPPPVAS
jgi:hypothetical protein